MLILLSCKSHAQTFKELATTATKAGLDGKYKEAISLYNKALKLDKGNYFVYNQLSKIYYHLQNLDSSLVYCNMTLAIAPNDTSALYQRGHCYMVKGSYQKALEDFSASFAGSKNRSSDSSFNIGQCYFGIGDVEKAIEYYKITLLLEPNDKYALYELGHCYASLDKPDKDNALMYYSKAIAQDKEYYDPYLNWGLLYATLIRDLKKAHADIERSIAIRPKNKNSYLYNGLLYRDEEDLGKAKDMFNKLIELHPDFAEAYFERAVTWYKIGVLNMVCKDLNKAEILGYTKATEAKKKFCK